MEHIKLALWRLLSSPRIAEERMHEASLPLCGA
jgi:hypothetical protein